MLPQGYPLSLHHYHGIAFLRQGFDEMVDAVTSAYEKARTSMEEEEHRATSRAATWNNAMDEVLND